jgi:RNA polymerase II subunit A small phosphatase-like protein
MTSGAVQPPGSTGDELGALLSPHPHQQIHHGVKNQHQHQHQHHTADGSVIDDESDETSFTEEEDGDDAIAALDDAEDEENRLIMNGGVGIPIGPVRF